MAHVYENHMDTGFGTFKRPENTWICDPAFTAEFVDTKIGDAIG